MNRTELQAVINNPLSDEQQRADAQKLLAATVSEPDLLDGYEWAAEAIARCIRLNSDPKTRHEFFEMQRKTYSTNPAGLRSYTPEREVLRATRTVYSSDGNRILGQAFDEDIEQFRKEMEG